MSRVEIGGVKVAGRGRKRGSLTSGSLAPLACVGDALLPWFNSKELLAKMLLVQNGGNSFDLSAGLGKLNLRPVIRNMPVLHRNGFGGVTSAAEERGPGAAGWAESGTRIHIEATKKLTGNQNFIRLERGVDKPRQEAAHAASPVPFTQQGP